jgi:hypothetical protein
VIEKDSNGDPMLPIFHPDKEPSLNDKKNILRSFFTSSYCMFLYLCLCTAYIVYIGGFTNNENAAVPWGRITSDPATWIDGWDKTITVKDPSKMAAADVTTLYQYLLERQSQGKMGLEWIQGEEDEKEKKKRGRKGKDKEAPADFEDGDLMNMDDGNNWMDDSDDNMEIGIKHGKGKEKEVPVHSEDEDELKWMDDDDDDVEKVIEDGVVGTTSQKRGHSIPGEKNSTSPAKRQRVEVKMSRSANTRYIAISNFTIYWLLNSTY